MQPNYPEQPGHRHADTSREAAKAVANSAATVRQMVLDQIRLFGMFGCTSDELAICLKLPYHTVQPRTSELVKLGLIKDTGMRRPKRDTGKNTIVWGLV